MATQRDRLGNGEAIVMSRSIMLSSKSISSVSSSIEGSLEGRFRLIGSEPLVGMESLLTPRSTKARSLDMVEIDDGKSSTCSC